MRPGLQSTAIRASGALLMVVLLSACGAAAAPTAASLAEAYVSSSLPATYADALPAATQLVLGIFRLEGTADALTPEQAAAQLPLWQALLSGAAQDGAETNAVLGQIEKSLTAEQLQAIAALQLTQEDLAAWVQEGGMAMRQPGGPGGTPGAMPGPLPGETPGPGGGGGYPGPRETMTDEQAARRATMVAGGEMPGGGRPGGFGGPSGIGTNQFRLLLPSLIALLTARAGS